MAGPPAPWTAQDEAWFRSSPAAGFPRRLAGDDGGRVDGVLLAVCRLGDGEGHLGSVGDAAELRGPVDDEQVRAARGDCRGGGADLLAVLPRQRARRLGEVVAVDGDGAVAADLAADRALVVGEDEIDPREVLGADEVPGEVLGAQLEERSLHEADVDAVAGSDHGVRARRGSVEVEASVEVLPELDAASEAELVVELLGDALGDGARGVRLDADDESAVDGGLDDALERDWSLAIDDGRDEYGPVVHAVVLRLVDVVDYRLGHLLFSFRWFASVRSFGHRRVVVDVRGGHPAARESCVCRFLLLRKATRVSARPTPGGRGSVPPKQP